MYIRCTVVNQLQIPIWISLSGGPTASDIEYWNAFEYVNDIDGSDTIYVL